jgi:hypothetical protein
MEVRDVDGCVDGLELDLRQFDPQFLVQIVAHSTLLNAVLTNV